MKFEAKNLSPVAFHALTCAEVSVSIQCFEWSKMAAEGFPVARTVDEYAKPCEPASHVLRSVHLTRRVTLILFRLGWKELVVGGYCIQRLSLPGYWPPNQMRYGIYLRESWGMANPFQELV